MTYYKHWQTREEREMKKGYFSISRRIVKRIILEGLIQKKDGMELDHNFSLSVGYSAHISLIVINNPFNLVYRLPTDNKRKSERCYDTVEELFSKWSGNDQKRYLKLISDFEDRSGISLDTFHRVIKV
jgi:type I site-specific restriction-modification system R (restriction) subunit